MLVKIIECDLQATIIGTGRGFGWCDTELLPKNPGLRIVFRMLAVLSRVRSRAETMTKVMGSS